MKMHEVTSPADKRLFLDMAADIYRDDPNWIRPLDKDIEAVFNPEQNKMFKRGECLRWILKDDQGRAIGRVAAFHSKQYKQSQPTGGIGFFECINDRKAAHFMLDHCKAWLQERGMEAMDGPINFGERDRWWGLLVEGFHPPLYCLNYNPPYYKELFESYGFRVYFHQIVFGLRTDVKLQPKFYQRHELIARDPNYRAVMFRKKDMEQFVKDFTYIYNKAWAGHGGGKELDIRTVRKMFQQMKPVIDEHIIWFVYYKDEPVALWVNLPDLNQYFKHFNGRFGLLEKLRFLWMQRFGTCDRFVGLVFGIIPEFQGKGVDAYLVVEAAKVVQQRMKYDNYEMLWIGDFNPKMVNIAESLGTERRRLLTTYRLLFDPAKEFKRHPMLG